MAQKRSKILFILHYPPPIHGAAMVGSYIKESTKVNTTFDSRYINLGTSKTIEEIGRSSFKKHFRFLMILVKCLKSLLQFKPDLVYFTLNSHGVGFYKDSLVVLMTKLFGIKVVYHFHNKGVSTKQNQWLDNLLYRLVFKNAEVIMLSKHLYQDIKKYVPESRVSYCPNGIPEVVDAQKIKLKRDGVEILFLSNLIESKGVFVLLEACKLLQNNNLNFHCTFTGGQGDINQQQLKRKVEELNLERKVQYLGRKYGKEKGEVLSRADILTLPTFYECFPLVLLEAMQYSLPVVSTYEGGIREIIDPGKTGFLVPQEDATALAEKLEILIKDANLRQKMGKAGRKKYEEQFTLQVFEEGLTHILTNIVAN